MKGISIFVLLSSHNALLFEMNFCFFLLLFREEWTGKRQVPISFPLCTLLFSYLFPVSLKLLILKVLLITCHISNSDMFLHDFISVSELSTQLPSVICNSVYAIITSFIFLSISRRQGPSVNRILASRYVSDLSKVLTCQFSPR